MLKRIATYLVIVALILSGCASQFSGMGEANNDCGYRKENFDAFSSCIRGKLNPKNLSTASSRRDQYKVAPSMQQEDVIDELNRKFIVQLDDLSARYENKSLLNRKKTKSNLNEAAYDRYDALVQQYAVEEQAMNKRAQTVAAIILLGAAAAGAAAYCNSHSCGGGGGTDYSDHQGCCSYHGGLAGYCAPNGHLMCRDGKPSPTCGC